MGRNLLQPAKCHRVASSQISVISLGIVFSYELKILAFRWHQIIQHTRIIKDLEPFALTDETFPVRSWNQSSTGLWGTHRAAANLGREAHRLTADHTYASLGTPWRDELLFSGSYSRKHRSTGLATLAGAIGLLSSYGGAAK
jgi:hypothetical protein